MRSMAIRMFILMCSLFPMCLRGQMNRPIQPTITSIIDNINNYAPVSFINFCNNTIAVDNATAFNAGDTVVIIQMKGASIDSSNTINFGHITNLNNTGRYEFNYVKNKTGNTIEFRNTFLNKYDAARGKVQLVRVPFFQALTVNDTLTCPAWDGAKGGVLVINAAAEVNLNAPIDVSRKGFRGGQVGGGFSCGKVSDWAMAINDGGMKGEGITEYITGFEAGGARLASGGGGAYAANSGGGGGGNYGNGGLGGSHSNTCPTTTQSMQGEAVNYTDNRVCLGGAGGGGQQDNNQPVSVGGNGGGIVIIKAFTLNGNNQQILANGESLNNIPVNDEGGAGGGAGGSVLLYVNGYAGNLSIEANGGDGTSNNNVIYPLRCHGPGGGGGGGYVGSSLVVLPPFVSTMLNGGRAGTVNNPQSACAGTTFNATDGSSGGSNFNLTLPEATIPFKKNIDSLRIHEQLITCRSFNFNGLAFTNTAPVQQWQWNFGDAATDTVQNTSHTYATYGTKTVKLVITDMNGCKDSTVKTVTTSGLQFDFLFEQQACSPTAINLQAIGDTTAEIFWSLGDGTVINNIRNPVHVYTDTGTYLIQYSTGNNTTGCIDTLGKNIFIGWRNGNVILTPDTTICYGSNKLLRSNIDSSHQFCWSPAGSLNNNSLAYPVTNILSSTTYTLLAAAKNSNLVQNGDFTNGATGFSSDYDAATAPLSTAEYYVANSSAGAGPAIANCTDHTTGSGNMLIIQNDFTTQSQLWGQTVAVLPNTNYTFNCWVQSLSSPNNTTLQLSINGTIAKDNIIISSPACQWIKQSVLWNSGNNTTADLAIFNKPVTPGVGGYIAIDDIEFSAFNIYKDSVTITVDTAQVNTISDTAVCEPVTVQLNSTGANTYTWLPSTGLSNAGIANPVASPLITTKYVVTGTNAFGCTATDSVTITVKPSPVITSTGDTTICQNTAVSLFASGGTRYSWEPAGLLDDATIATPAATAASNDVEYFVTVTGSNNCSSKDSFIVTAKALPVFTVSPDAAVCLNSNAQLNAGGGDLYRWSPATLVSDALINNPLAITNQPTTYTVLIRDTVCGFDTTLNTHISILPKPAVTAVKENDINCAVGTAQLTATGATTYNWTPAATLNNATIATPVASNINTTLYTATGTDSNGCSNTATVTVNTDYTAKVSYAVPNAFSPNADGKNDCFKVKYFGLITELQLTVYNRYGQMVFSTTDPNDCWDGSFKGVPCSPGSFVYFIKAKTTCGNVERKGSILLIR